MNGSCCDKVCLCHWALFSTRSSPSGNAAQGVPSIRAFTQVLASELMKGLIRKQRKQVSCSVKSGHDSVCQVCRGMSSNICNNTIGLPGWLSSRTSWKTDTRLSKSSCHASQQSVSFLKVSLDTSGTDFGAYQHEARRQHFHCGAARLQLAEILGHWLEKVQHLAVGHAHYGKC